MGTASTRDVVTHAAPAPRPPLTVCRFLDSINPDELAEAALTHVGGLCGPTTGEAFLLALKKMAEDADA